MAFDMAWGFRASEVFVTDPAYQVFDGGITAYPETYTNVAGDSVNGGWEVVSAGGQDTDATNDPRIAGRLYRDGNAAIFRVDLDSGSAPGAGAYDVDIAAGDPGVGGTDIEFELRDTTTALITKAYQGGFAADNYIDATLTQRVATTTWNGVASPQTFSTTIARLVINQDNSGSHFPVMAHFRLTAADAQAIFTQDHIGRGIGRGIFAGR